MVILLAGGQLPDGASETVTIALVGNLTEFTVTFVHSCRGLFTRSRLSRAKARLSS